MLSQSSLPIIPPRVPVTIVTGFLGAGKTSLLNHILTSKHGRRLAVLVNDFGAVNIDADLIDRRDGEVVSLENGCVCCSLSDGLLASTIRLIRQVNPPEHIIIETSGVANPIEVARTFSDPELQPYAPLDGIITVVDAELGPTLEGEGLPLARCQLAAADIAILNKTDLVDEEGQKRARDWVHQIVPTARLLNATLGRVPIELILGHGGTSNLKEIGNSHQRHDEPPFDSFTYESDIPLPLQRLHRILRGLPQTVFRVKGILNLQEKTDYRCILQATGRRATIEVDQPWGEKQPITQIVFIGSRGGVDSDRLHSLLSGEKEHSSS